MSMRRIRKTKIGVQGLPYTLDLTTANAGGGEGRGSSSAGRGVAIKRVRSADGAGCSGTSSSSSDGFSDVLLGEDPVRRPGIWYRANSDSDAVNARVRRHAGDTDPQHSGHGIWATDTSYRMENYENNDEHLSNRLLKYLRIRVDSIKKSGDRDTDDSSSLHGAEGISKTSHSSDDCKLGQLDPSVFMASNSTDYTLEEIGGRSSSKKRRKRSHKVRDNETFSLDMMHEAKHSDTYRKRTTCFGDTGASRKGRGKRTAADSETVGDKLVGEYRSREREDLV